MKALFLADLYQAKTNIKFYSVFIAVAVVITVYGGVSGSSSGMFFSIYAMIMGSMMGMTLLQLDEASRWNICAQALPCTRRDQVTGKYALALACAGATWVLFTLVYAVLALLGHMAWDMVLFQAGLLLVMGLAAPAIILPPMFRWGSAKGRIVYVAVIAIAAGGLGAAFSVIGDMASGLPELPGVLSAVLALLIPAALFVGSWRLSVRWYEKREL